MMLAVFAVLLAAAVAEETAETKTNDKRQIWGYPGMMYGGWPGMMYGGYGMYGGMYPGMGWYGRKKREATVEEETPAENNDQQKRQLWGPWGMYGGYGPWGGFGYGGYGGYGMYPGMYGGWYGRKKREATLDETEETTKEKRQLWGPWGYGGMGPYGYGGMYGMWGGMYPGYGYGGWYGRKKREAVAEEVATEETGNDQRKRQLWGPWGMGMGFGYGFGPYGGWGYPGMYGGWGYPGMGWYGRKKRSVEETAADTDCEDCNNPSKRQLWGYPGFYGGWGYPGMFPGYGMGMYPGFGYGYGMYPGFWKK